MIWGVIVAKVEELRRLPLIDLSAGIGSFGDTAKEIVTGFLGENCQFNSVNTGPGYTSVRGLPDSKKGTTIITRQDHQPERVFTLKGATITPVKGSETLVPFLNAVAKFQNARVK